MTAYYNEHDAYAAEWLRSLIAAGHIAPGDVDERSIEDVTPDELMGYTQCHFFVGIGVWSYALRRAGWPDDRPVWTGSCPCQPFSAAGKGKGHADERHLWPAFHWLIQQCQPGTVFGEQVASKDGLAWLDTVQTDLENTGYSSGAIDLCAAGVGAPHIRQRLWFAAERMADTEIGRGGTGLRDKGPAQQRGDIIADSISDGWLGDTIDPGLEGHAGDGDRGNEPGRQQADQDRPIAETGGGCELADCGGWIHGPADDAGSTNGFWREADWLGCRDGKWRAVEPGTFPLAHGAAGRVGRLRAYGNAINAEAAEVLIASYMDL